MISIIGTQLLRNELQKKSHIVMHACMHCIKCGVTEHPRGAIFYCFRSNSMGYHGNMKILLLWGILIHRIFYSVAPAD